MQLICKLCIIFKKSLKKVTSICFSYNYFLLCFCVLFKAVFRFCVLLTIFVKSLTIFVKTILVTIFVKSLWYDIFIAIFVVTIFVSGDNFCQSFFPPYQPAHIPLTCKHSPHSNSFSSSVHIITPVSSYHSLCSWRSDFTLLPLPFYLFLLFLYTIIPLNYILID